MDFGWIAFLTDYGRRDGFVATCHGVIARIAPAVRVIDVTHDVPPQDVRHGAVVLAQTLPYLPPSVVVGVVDPGVGTRRRAVALVAGEHVLIGPDNGLLPWAADACGGVSRAVELTSEQYRLATDAATFDGRDVFAPAAAHVATGVRLSDLGADLPPTDIVRLPKPRVQVRPGILDTEVHVVDHFGNVALAARQSDLESAGLAGTALLRVTAEPSGGDAVVTLPSSPGKRGSAGMSSSSPGKRGSAGVRSVPFRRSFADVEPGELVVLVDSSGHLALAVNHGSASELLGLRPGDRVVVTG